MRVVLSRVHGATCEVEGEIVSQIENGLLLIVGFGVDDDEETVKRRPKSDGCGFFPMNRAR